MGPVIKMALALRTKLQTCAVLFTLNSKENLLFLMSLEEEVSHGQTWQGSILPVQVVTFKRQVF